MNYVKKYTSINDAAEALGAIKVNCDPDLIEGQASAQEYNKEIKFYIQQLNIWEVENMK